VGYWKVCGVTQGELVEGKGFLFILERLVEGHKGFLVYARGKKDQPPLEFRRLTNPVT